MLVKKTLMLLFFLNLFFPVNAAVNITDLVQAITLDEKKDNGEASNQIIFNLTNTGDKPATLAVEVHLAKLAKDGHLEVGEESDDFQIIPESLTVEAGDTSLVTACFDGDTPKKEKIYMVGFRFINIKAHDGKNTEMKFGLDVEHVIYALVYVRTSDMKANITDVKYLGNGKISVTNKGNRTARVGDIQQTIVVDGVTKKVEDLVVSSEQAIFADSVRILDIDKTKFEFKTSNKSNSKNSNSKNKDNKK